jgi:hypothetical protein
LHERNNRLLDLLAQGFADAFLVLPADGHHLLEEGRFCCQGVAAK